MLMKKRVSISPSGFSSLQQNAIVNGKEAVRIHEEKTREVRQQLSALKTSLSDLSKVMSDVSGAYEKYCSVLTNASEPEVVLAHNGSDKLCAYLKRFAGIVNESIREFDNIVFEPYAVVETKIRGAKNTLHKYKDAYENAEKARQNVEVQSKKKNNTTAFVKAQEEESEALRECSKVQKETIAAQCQAVSVANKQCVDSFDAFYSLLHSLFRRGNDILSDMKITQEQLMGEKEAIKNALSVSSNEPDSESVITEQLEELTVGERKFITLLSALQAVAKCFADQGLPHCPEKVINGMISAIKALQEVHETFRDVLVAAADAVDKGQAIMNGISTNYATFELQYYAFIDQLPYFVALLEKFHDSRGFKPVLKLFEQSCRETGLTGDDILSVFSAVCRHPSSILLRLKTIVTKVSVINSSNGSWFGVHDMWNQFCTSMDKARDASEHMRELVRLQDTLQGVPDLVTKSRVFQLDSDVICFSVDENTDGNGHMRDMSPVSPTSQSALGSDATSSASGSSIDGDPLSRTVPSGKTYGSMGSSMKKSISMMALAELQQGKSLRSSVAASSPAGPTTATATTPTTPTGAGAGAEGAGLNDLQVGVKYRMYLFNDIILFARAVPKKTHAFGSSSEKVYTVCARYLTRHLALIPDEQAKMDDDPSSGRFVFGMTHPTGSFRLSVSTFDQRALWTAYLERTITERNKQYVFGVPLEQLMASREDYSRDVPPVLMDAATYVKLHCEKAEGIFRLSSSTADLECAREEIDAGLTPQYNDVYLAANIIKLWLRSLPEPLMTNDLYDKWIAAKDDPEGLRKLVSHLPLVNRFILCDIICLMAYLEKKKDTTKMNASNLAIVMTPNLLSKDGARFVSEPQEVVETLILNYSTIFRETEEFREKARNERASAKRGRMLRSQQTSRSLTSKDSVMENRRIAPHALAIKKEFNLAAPQDIPPPPPPPVDDDIIPPPLSKSPIEADSIDIGPPTDVPPPIVVPASPVRSPNMPSITSPVGPSSGVLPGFSQSLIPPPVLSPVSCTEDIPPPPPEDLTQKKMPTALLMDSGSTPKKKSHHRASASTSASLGISDGKKKHHHKEKNRLSSSFVRDKSEPVTIIPGAKPDSCTEGYRRLRTVSSEWANMESSGAAASKDSLISSDNVSLSSDQPQVGTGLSSPGDPSDP